MRINLWEALSYLGVVIWPTLPSTGHVVTYQGKLYKVVFITHDFDSRDTIDMVLERI